MSAFICGPDLFKALAVFAAQREFGGSWRVDPRYVEGLTHPQAAKRGIEHLTNEELATLYGDTLYQENLRSVAARYSNCERTDLPGPCDDPGFIAVTHRDFNNPAYKRVEPVALLKMMDCLTYQSCETNDWQESVAYRLLQSMRLAVIRTLPGYDDAPWDYYAAEARAA